MPEHITAERERYPVKLPENPHDLGESVYQLKIDFALMGGDIAAIKEQLQTIIEAREASRFGLREIFGAIAGGVVACGVVMGGITAGVSFYVSSAISGQVEPLKASIAAQVEPLKTAAATSSLDYNSRFSSISASITDVRKEQLETQKEFTALTLRIRELELRMERK